MTLTKDGHDFRRDDFWDGTKPKTKGKYIGYSKSHDVYAVFYSEICEWDGPGDYYNTLTLRYIDKILPRSLMYNIHFILPLIDCRPFGTRDTLVDFFDIYAYRLGNSAERPITKD